MSTTRLASQATRIAAGDDRIGYDGPEKTFHWATVVLVLLLYGLSQAWGWAPRGGPLRRDLIVLHLSCGLVLTLVLALRIAWRVGPGRRVLPASTGLVERAAQAVHYLLYLLLIAQVVLGFLFRWGSGQALSFFGLFLIPSPMAVLARPQRHLVAELHDWTAYAILAVAAAHAAAALFHHLVLRDDVLMRMLPGRRARREERAMPDPRQVETGAR